MSLPIITPALSDALLSLVPGASATPLELRDFLGDKVSKIEMPREIEVSERIPKTLIGKLSKKEPVEEEQRKADSDRR